MLQLAACLLDPPYAPLYQLHSFRAAINRNKTKHLPHLSLTLDNAEGSDLGTPRSNSVTRRLILLRHADSSGNNHSLRDHERPLSKNGRVDAADVSYRLQLLAWVPELILCSDAMRTKETLSVMQERVKGFLQSAVHFIPSFYSVAAMDGQTAEHLQQMSANCPQMTLLQLCVWDITEAGRKQPLCSLVQ